MRESELKTTAIWYYILSATTIVLICILFSMGELHTTLVKSLTDSAQSTSTPTAGHKAAHWAALYQALPDLLIVLAATSLCFLWYVAFRYRALSPVRRGVFSLQNGSLLLPAFLSLPALGMSRNETFIVLLAIFAIAIAGEHLVSLEDTSNSSKKLVNDVRDILPFKTDASWRPEIIKAYGLRPDSRISAVIRHWEIDVAWMTAYKQNPTTPLAELWKQYVGTPGTLGHAFRINSRGVKHFVFDQTQFPHVIAWNALSQEHLEQLVALTWQVNVFHFAYYGKLCSMLEDLADIEARKSYPPTQHFPSLATFRIGAAPFWFHAVGSDQAFLLIDYSPTALQEVSASPIRALVKPLVPEGKELTIATAPTVARLHEYLADIYQQGSRGVPWLSSIWLELLRTAGFSDVFTRSETRVLFSSFLSKHPVTRTVVDEMASRGMTADLIADTIFIFVRSVGIGRELRTQHKKRFREEKWNWRVEPAQSLSPDATVLRRRFDEGNEKDAAEDKSAGSNEKRGLAKLAVLREEMFL